MNALSNLCRGVCKVGSFQSGIFYVFAFSIISATIILIFRSFMLSVDNYYYISLLGLFISALGSWLKIIENHGPCIEKSIEKNKITIFLERTKIIILLSGFFASIFLIIRLAMAYAIGQQ